MLRIAARVLWESFILGQEYRIYHAAMSCEDTLCGMCELCSPKEPRTAPHMQREGWRMVAEGQKTALAACLKVRTITVHNNELVRAG